MKRAIVVALFVLGCGGEEMSFPVQPPRVSGDLRAMAGSDAIDCGLALDRASALHVYGCASNALRNRSPFFCRYAPPVSDVVDRSPIPQGMQSTWEEAFVGDGSGTVYGVRRSRSGACSRGPAIVGPRIAAALRRVHAGMMPPMPVSDASASLPKRAATITGIVILECVINARGAVVDARVLKALPLDIDKAALQLVSTTPFEPARFFGVAMPVVYNVTVNVSNGTATVRRQPDAGPVMPQGDIPRALRGVT